ncbi:phospholipase A2 inhibitor and Ly6/PLAUR domain-containing protein-like [Sceloporus undulatus]|uniref:phospholipase A2 inhibitor and Ly6/PLAUR domain-containing protein-like n=1 Tax=Sceloporus undulatus TaxID=8520 RepID=UPI001C4CEFA8|nr:phospholipase A2 inhibitor and Ly6/PLAUR domain-containing protein-like [Sceloporus undulatus]
MQSLLGLTISFVLITAGVALECEVCTSVGTSCTGTMQTCEAGKDTCIIIVTESTMNGMQIPTVVKTCESSSHCKYGPQYMHFGQGQEFRTAFSCCVGDACRTATPQLPPVVTKHNRKQCPACYSLFSGICNQEEMVDCVGEENDCLHVAATVTYGTSVINTVQKGCATKGFCADLNVGEFSTMGLRSLITRAECKAASTTA